MGTINPVSYTHLVSELLSEYQIQYTAKRIREGSSLCLKRIDQSV